jgi:hypothetical protein
MIPYSDTLYSANVPLRVRQFCETQDRRMGPPRPFELQQRIELWIRCCNAIYAASYAPRVPPRIPSLEHQKRLIFLLFSNVTCETFHQASGIRRLDDADIPSYCIIRRLADRRVRQYLSARGLRLITNDSRWDYHIRHAVCTRHSWTCR